MPGTIILSSRNSDADRRNTHNDNDGGDGDGDVNSKKRKRSISSTIMNLFQGINMDRNKTVFSLGSRYAASTPSKDVSNNNILNEKMAVSDECNSRSVKRKRTNRDESTVGSDLTYRERRNHDIERGSIILYESDSNADCNGNNTVTRPPVLPLLPIQRLRLLRQKQRLREQVDLIRWSRLQSSSSSNGSNGNSTSSSSSLGKDIQGESSQATDAVVDQQVQDSSFNIDDSVLGDGIRSVHRVRVNTKPMDSSIRLKSPRLLEKRRRQRPATGFRWSGSFEYDMSEYETRSSSQSDGVNDQVQPVTNDGRGKFGDVHVIKQKDTEKDEKEVTKRGSGDDVQPGRRTVGETTPDTSYLRASSEGTHVGNLTATQRDILLNGPKEPSEPSAAAHGKMDEKTKHTALVTKTPIISSPDSSKDRDKADKNIKIGTLQPTAGFNFVTNTKLPSIKTASTAVDGLKKTSDSVQAGKPSTSSEAPIFSINRPDSSASEDATRTQAPRVSFSFSNKTIGLESTPTPSNIPLSSKQQETSQIYLGQRGSGDVSGRRDGEEKEEEEEKDSPRRKKRPTIGAIIDATEGLEKPKFTFPGASSSSSSATAVVAQAEKKPLFEFSNSAKSGTEATSTVKKSPFTFTLNKPEDKTTSSKPVVSFGLSTGSKDTSTGTTTTTGKTSTVGTSNSTSLFNFGSKSTNNGQEQPSDNKQSKGLAFSSGTDGGLSDKGKDTVPAPKQPLFSFAAPANQSTTTDKSVVEGKGQQAAFSFSVKKPSDNVPSASGSTTLTAPSTLDGKSNEQTTLGENKQGDKPSGFSFGGNTIASNGTKPTFSFGNKTNTSNEPPKPTFSFNNNTTETTATKPSFTFGKKEAISSETKPSFSFGSTTGGNITSKPSFSFSKPQSGTTAQQPKPSSSFGSTASSGQQQGVTATPTLANNGTQNGAFGNKGNAGQVSNSSFSFNVASKPNIGSKPSGTIGFGTTNPSTSSGGFTFNRLPEKTQTPTNANSSFPTQQGFGATSTGNSTNSFKFNFNAGTNSLGKQVNPLLTSVNQTNPLLSTSSSGQGVATNPFGGNSASPAFGAFQPNNTNSLQSGGSVFGTNANQPQGGNVFTGGFTSQNMFNSGANAQGMNANQPMGFGQPQQTNTNTFQPSATANFNFGNTKNVDPASVFSAQPAQVFGGTTQATTPQPNNLLFGRKIARMRQPRR